MPTVNLYFRINKALLIAGGVLTAGLLMTIGENRCLRKELEQRTAHNEANIRFIFKKLKALENEEVH